MSSRRSPVVSGHEPFRLCPRGSGAVWMARAVHGYEGLKGGHGHSTILLSKCNEDLYIGSLELVLRFPILTRWRRLPVAASVTLAGPLEPGLGRLKASLCDN